MTMTRAKTIGWMMVSLGLAGPLAAQQAEVYPLPESVTPEAIRVDVNRDEDEVHIPQLPGTAAMQPPAAPAAQAQPEAGDTPAASVSIPRPTAGTVTEVGAQQIDRFVRSHREVTAIHARYTQLFPAADAEERFSLAESGNAEMRTAIERNGLSVAQYNAISLRRWEDPEFARRISSALAPNPEAAAQR
jgi:hypothetical protein